MLDQDSSVAARSVEILLVEDNPADVWMMREALRTLGVAHRLHVVDNGESALAFLGRAGEFETAPRPDLVLLDMSLPRLGGHGVLAAMREAREVNRFPVVVMTGSRDEKSAARSVELGADAHIVKGSTFKEISAELQIALDFVSPRGA